MAKLGLGVLLALALFALYVLGADTRIRPAAAGETAANSAGR